MVIDLKQVRQQQRGLRPMPPGYNPHMGYGRPDPGQVPPKHHGYPGRKMSDNVPGMPGWHLHPPPGQQFPREALPVGYFWIYRGNERKMYAPPMKPGQPR